MKIHGILGSDKCYGEKQGNKNRVYRGRGVMIKGNRMEKVMLSRDLEEVPWLSRETALETVTPKWKHTCCAHMCACHTLIFPLTYLITSTPFNFFIETIFACFCQGLR